MSHYTDLIKDYYEKLQGEPGENQEIDFRPLYCVDYNDERQLIAYLTTTLGALQEEAGPRTENQMRNIMFYQGVHSLENYDGVEARDYDNIPVSSNNRFVMNHIMELTLQKQARLRRFSPTVNVFPWNNSYADRLSSRLGKKVIDSAFYIHNFDSILDTVTLEAAICGESFTFWEWDKYAGDKTKEHILAEQRKEALGSNFNFVNEEGQKIDLRSIPRVGDHSIVSPLPFQVLHQPRAKWKDVDYIFYCKVKHIDEVKAENAHLGSKTLAKIENTARQSSGVTDPAVFEAWGCYVLEWTFYHRYHRFVPYGKYARFFNNILIEHSNLPYSHGKLPVARFTDYDSLVSAHGRSFYESLKLPSVMINNMMKVAYRSFVLSAYPKIVMQQDSTNMYTMANGPFVMEYLPGAQKPEIVSFNAVNADFFPLSDHVEKFMEKNSGTFGISRGEQIPNARARSILNFYEEQEQERESTQIRKINAFIEKSGKFVLANSADYYKPNDGRTLRVVGRNNVHKLLKMSEQTKLSGEHNVKIARTTALAESKQGRIDQIAALSQLPVADNPGGASGLFTRQQILSMIEVGDTSTFFEMATAAVEAANSENEDLFENKQVEAPTEWQDHLVHWNCHYQWIQSREFSDTEGVPKKVREATLDHLRTHELFLYKAAQFNLALATLLSQNQYFPAVMKFKETDLPLSQLVILLQQPPLPPAPPMGMMEGEGQPPAPTDLPPEDVIPPDEAPLPDNVPTNDLPPEAFADAVPMG